MNSRGNKKGCVRMVGRRKENDVILIFLKKQIKKKIFQVSTFPGMWSLFNQLSLMSPSSLLEEVFEFRGSCYELAEASSLLKVVGGF